MDTLTILNRPWGLFSNLLHIIDNLYWCKLNKFYPKILWNNGLYCVNYNIDNVWDYYFEKIIIDYTPNCNNLSYISDTFKVDNFIFENVSNLERSKLWDINSFLKNEMRENVSYIIKKYVKINKIINDKINDFTFDKKTIGVHIRGTDYSYIKNIGINKFIDSIKNIDNYEDCDIFVASDNFESIELVKNTFKNVKYYPCIYRQEKYASKQPSCFVNDTNKKAHGEEVLIESILLSKCNKIVCTTSNVSLFALLYNPNNEFILVE